jgi:hypothetical protein
MYNRQSLYTTFPVIYPRKRTRKINFELINYFFRWPLVNFNINELFCLKYSVLMDLIITLFFINQRLLRF